MISAEEVVRRSREVAAPPPARGLGAPLWGRGFRPFFLGGAAAAALLVPLWIVALSGGITPGGSLGGVLWHAHEMVWGFAVAIVAGFLLTAVPNWTKGAPAQGGRLAALFGVWVAGRIAVFLGGSLPEAGGVAVDLAFLPALLAVLAPSVVKAKEARNVGVLLVVFALWGADVLVHATQLGWVEGSPLVGLRSGVAWVAVLMGVIGGRVIPFFTRAGLEREGEDFQPRPRAWIDGAAVAAQVAFAAALMMDLPPGVIGGVGVVAGLLVAGRMWGWGASRTRGRPLLWILFVGYGWIVVGCVVWGASLLGAEWPVSAAIHALTAGAMGSLILGMITRVSLGHSGRPLVVGRAVVVSYVLVISAGLLRVLGPVLVPAATTPVLHTSAALWASAFAVFLWIYTPILLGPRPDGKPA